MTAPDFDAMAREYGETWDHTIEERNDLSALLRSVHAAGREAGVREAADECSEYAEEQEADLEENEHDSEVADLLSGEAAAARACHRLILALLPPETP